MAMCQSLSKGNNCIGKSLGFLRRPQKRINSEVECGEKDGDRMLATVYNAAAQGTVRWNMELFRKVSTSNLLAFILVLYFSIFF